MRERPRADAHHASTVIHRALAAWRGTGAQLLRPHFLALLAEAEQAESAGADVVQILDEAIAAAESTTERCYAAELCRLKGECLATRGTDQDLADADRWFEQSLVIAREQKARSLEFRTAVRVAQRLLDRAQPVGARDLLLPILERFEEGLDTPDLQEARGLLDVLAPC